MKPGLCYVSSGFVNVNNLIYCNLVPCKCKLLVKARINFGFVMFFSEGWLIKMMALMKLLTWLPLLVLTRPCQQRRVVDTGCFHSLVMSTVLENKKSAPDTNLKLTQNQEIPQRLTQGNRELVNCRRYKRKTSCLGRSCVTDVVFPFEVVGDTILENRESPRMFL